MMVKSAWQPGLMILKSYTVYYDIYSFLCELYHEIAHMNVRILKLIKTYSVDMGRGWHNCKKVSFNCSGCRYYPKSMSFCGEATTALS